ncbi:MAG: UDP-N-acetylglucosamine 1-carboxyvinyltransferase [Sulfurospirillum sp.]|nr:UDP-N-acetylglucosamine 1-carboxyvinyltransferase [Sulfurospirillum sp.]MBL0702428.1 UDP-N-acetylglucosamine 1-carboxyvinyltransferase [Sulfurospirillum sp.]
MQYLSIKGNQKLKGSVGISGAKNAALPLLAVTLLSKNRVSIENIPEVEDVKTLLTLLGNLGSNSSCSNNHVTIDTTEVKSACANYEIVKKMRASILTLGPLLARFGHCEVSLPGGCAIGQRPIDLHLNALEQMGATIELKDGYVVAKAPNGLKGAAIIFNKITVTGSENIIMAASLAHGVTKLVNVAKEPEVVQLCEVLQDAGVVIEGVGTSNLIIFGSCGKLLDMKNFKVIPDRIEAGTYLCAGAITNSKITVTNVNPNHMKEITLKLIQMGFGIKETKSTITILPAKKILPIHIETTEYPGFPTDMQAQFMALCTQANGTSVINERLFENRFMHVSELGRMGTNIKLEGHSATIQGDSQLNSADVMATDLRASSALILAGFVAKGTTKIHRIYHLDRGYENLEGKFSKLGAKIERLEE